MRMFRKRRNNVLNHLAMLADQSTSESSTDYSTSTSTSYSTSSYGSTSSTGSGYSMIAAGNSSRMSWSSYLIANNNDSLPSSLRRKNSNKRSSANSSSSKKRKSSKSSRRKSNRSVKVVLLGTDSLSEESALGQHCTVTKPSQRKKTNNNVDINESLPADRIKEKRQQQQENRTEEEEEIEPASAVAPAAESQEKSKKKKSNKKNVTFGTVEVRKYSMILGDHPDCRAGPPVTIDWEYFATKQFPLELVESQRTGRRLVESELIMLPSIRRKILEQ